MKKLYLVSFAVALFTACTDGDENLDNQLPYDIRVLTFEDADYKGTDGSSYWSSLIDDTQYGGKLLYGESGKTSTYAWNDENNTFLAHEFDVNPDRYIAYYSGGHAVSNYVDQNLSNGDYTHQLAVPIKDAATGFGGHDGSKNFCVHDGYSSSYTTAPSFYFSDGISRVIDHMYVAPTTYVLNVEKNGNGMASALGSDGWFKIVATGLDEDGNVTGTAEFYLYKDGKAVEDWTKWELSSLGKVLMVQFDMQGSDSGDYGLNTPAYFAYDDVAVRFD